MKKIGAILTTLRRRHKPTMLESYGSKPFTILVSTILSARTRDATTIPIARRLFKKYRNPEDFAKASLKRLESEIYGVNFYHGKARRLKELSAALVERYGSRVPAKLEKLLELPGVGRKTANCVLVYGFHKPAIPVDIHVHRISNRLGIVRTKTPDETERKLMQIVPKKYWIEINELFVRHGQTVCLPVSPFCSKCPIKKYCKRVGVKRSQ